MKKKNSFLFVFMFTKRYFGVEKRWLIVEKSELLFNLWIIYIVHQSNSR